MYGTERTKHRLTTLGRVFSKATGPTSGEPACCDERQSEGLALVGGGFGAPIVCAVIVTRDRPALLSRCLDHVARQTAVHTVLVVDNASGPDTAPVLAGRAGGRSGLRTLRMVRNAGGAGGFWVGITAALQGGAEWVWLMDDDGYPRHPECLATLLETASRYGADMVGALVVDVDAPERLAFPVRIDGRTVFDTAPLAERAPVPGFAHLFNGVLVRAELFRRIGLPDPRFLLRGDEVEFLYRARHAGARIVLDTGAVFHHPGSHAEIHPILGGRFYAVVPQDAVKQFLQFRNRGYIFRRYGMWLWLLADVVRYGCHFLASRRDLPGFVRWAGATWQGVHGEFMRRPGEPGASHRVRRRSQAATRGQDGRVGRGDQAAITPVGSRR